MNGQEKVVEKNGSFSLTFCQIVALMLPYRSVLAGLLLRGVCPILTVLLRRTICDHLRRARPEKILNGFQRIHLRFFHACGLASGHTSFASSRRAMSDRLLAILFPPVFKMKLALSREEESQCTFRGGNSAHIVHEGFYCNRGYAVATGVLATQSIDILFQVCLPSSWLCLPVS